MTKTQAATLARITELTQDGPLDITYGGIKGVNRSSLWALEDKGAIIVERVYENNVVISMKATIA